MGDSNEDYGISKRSAVGLLLGGSVVVLGIGLLVGYVYTTGELPSFGGRDSSNSQGAPAPMWKPAIVSAPEEAALSGSREVRWDAGRMRFRVPADFAEAQITEQSAWYQNPTGTIALVASASPVTSRIEPEPYLESLHSQHRPKRKIGTYDLLEYLEVDGVKGVVWRECPTQKPETPRRLQWTGFRTLDGEQQTVSISITATGEAFAANQTLISAMLHAAVLK